MDNSGLVDVVFCAAVELDDVAGVSFSTSRLLERRPLRAVVYG